MFKKSFMVSFINIISRMLGLIREVLMATFFGSTGYTDAYFASSRIANFFTTLLSDGSMGTVLIPLYLEKKEKKGNKEADDFIVSIIYLLFNFSIFFAILTFFLSKPILKYLIGFTNTETLKMANDMLKIMAFYIVFIAISGVVSAYLNSYKKFFISSLVGIAFNITLIIGLIISNKTIGIFGLSITFLISGLIQLAVQIPSFYKLLKIKKININLKDKYVKEFFILMLPTLVGIFAYQINEIVDTNFASKLTEGTISSINYASRLYLLPVGIFAVSFSTVIYTHLTEAIIKGNKKLADKMFTQGMNLISFFIIPCMFGLFFFSKDIISLVFNYGKFNQDNVIMTSQILMCYAIGLLFFGQNHMLIRVHYANKNRKLPVIASMLAILLNILLDYLLYKQYAHIGLTLATVLSAFLNYSILIVSVKIQYINFNIAKQLIFLAKIVLSCILCLLITNNFNNILIKILIFMIVYGLIWSYPFYKKRFEIFS